MQTFITCFLPPHAQHLRLSQPLGTFLHTSIPCWLWWHSPSSNSLYRCNGSLWDIWTPLLNQYRANRYTSGTSTTPDLPSDAIRATVYHRPPNTTAILKNVGHQDPAPIDPPMVTFQSRIDSLPPDTKWALEFFEATMGTELIAQAIQDQHCYAVTDASFKDCTGTAAFIMVSTTDEGHIKAVNTVPGPLKDGDSYRSELAGLFGIVLLTTIICQHHNITSGAVHVRCDNISSLHVFEPWFVPEPCMNSFDLVNAIWCLLQESPINWTAAHVKGHQDSKPRSHPLDRFEILNCHMDALAKEYRTNILALNPNRRAASFQIVNEGWSIWHNDEKLASPGRKILYECVYAPIILQYWTTPHTLTPAPRFPPAAATMIDWVATEDLMTCLNPSKQRWCMKHGSENCGVGATLLYWKKQLDDECPRCRASEDTTHVLRCTAHNASVIWNTNMDLMKDDLASLETPLQLQTALLNRLQCWRDNSPLTADPLWTPSLASLIHSQDTIGWKNFMEGLPSNLWSPFMALHYKTNSIERRPKIWLRKILRAAHHLAWSQWEHCVGGC